MAIILHLEMKVANIRVHGHVEGASSVASDITNKNEIQNSILKLDGCIDNNADNQESRGNDQGPFHYRIGRKDCRVSSLRW